MGQYINIILKVGGIKMARDLAALLNLIAEDSEFAELLKKDPQKVASILEWSPEEIVTYTIDDDVGKHNCGSNCGCASDQGAGCRPTNGGYTECPSGRPGHYNCTYGVSKKPK